MKQAIQPFTSNIRRCGYLKVGRSQLKALFSRDLKEQQLATVLLCVQTFAFFSEGQVCTLDGVYLCRAGEWITSYTEVADFTGLDRRSTKMRLMELEKMKFIQIENLIKLKRIRLADEGLQPSPAVGLRPTQPLQPSEAAAVGSLLSRAGSFYTYAGGQEGGACQ